MQLNGIHYKMNVGRVGGWELYNVGLCPSWTMRLWCPKCSLLGRPFWVVIIWSRNYIWMNAGLFISENVVSFVQSYSRSQEISTLGSVFWLGSCLATIWLLQVRSWQKLVTVFFKPRQRPRVQLPLSDVKLWSSLFCVHCIRRRRLYVAELAEPFSQRRQAYCHV